MPNCTFPALHRLNHSSDFDAVFKKTEFREGRRVFLCLAKRNERGFNRLGMIVGKKNIANAVGRNRVKRQIREAFRHLPPGGTGLDILVLARAGAEKHDGLMTGVMEVFSLISEQAAE